MARRSSAGRSRNPRVASMQRDGRDAGWGMAAAPAGRTLPVRRERRAGATTDGSRVVRTQDIGTGTYTISRSWPAKGWACARQGGVSSETRGCRRAAFRRIRSDDAAVVPAVLRRPEGNRCLAGLGAKCASSKLAGRKARTSKYENGRVHAWGEPAGAGHLRSQRFLRAGNLRVCPLPALRGHSGEFEPEAGLLGHSFGDRGGHLAAGDRRGCAVMPRGPRSSTPAASSTASPGAIRSRAPVVMGIGMSLFEETSVRSANGAPINSNLADYIVAGERRRARAGSPFRPIPRHQSLNELGARGIGEIGSQDGGRHRERRLPRHRGTRYASCRSRSRTCSRKRHAHRESSIASGAFTPLPAAAVAASGLLPP